MVFRLWLWEQSRAHPQVAASAKGRRPKKKSRLLLDIVQKGGGFNPNPKVFGVVFLGLSFGHFPKKGEVEPIPKVLG